MPRPKKDQGIVLTVGHSTRPWEAFLDILRKHGVERVADVRTIPRSRRNPQFDQNELSKNLKEAGIDYVHWKELGGLRHPRRDSENTGWRNESFRGYADYMQTKEFERALERFLGGAFDKRTALMCAEAVPWRCHRSLIADALLARNISVEHILGEAHTQPHALTPFAKVQGTQVTYPGAKPASSKAEETPNLFEGLDRPPAARATKHKGK